MSELFKAFLKHETAIHRIIRRYFPRAEDVEDLTQETFLKCFVAETRMEIRDPKAFLFRVAKNTALSEVKKKSLTMTDYLEESSLFPEVEDESQRQGEVLLDERRQLAALAKVVAALPEEVRQALLMRKMEGLKYRQIAVRLNLPLATVHRLIAKAVVQCSQALREQGFDVPDAASADGGGRLVPVRQGVADGQEGVRR